MLASTTSAPVPRTCSGVSARTAAWVPTTMKPGVCTGPWGVERTPVRASLERLPSSNWKGFATSGC